MSKTRTARARRLLRTAGLLLALPLLSAGASSCAHGGLVIGTVVTALPHGFLTISVGTGHLYFYDGFFYRTRGPRYVVVRPPLGVFVPLLPRGYRIVHVREVPYAYYRGIFYKEDPRRGWEVVRPPVGAQVDRLPEGAARERIDGVDYYVYAGVWYRPTVIGRSTAYVVADVQRP
ncbi:MAG: DUF6515 family protein [Gemmatimonadota bacterium]